MLGACYFSGVGVRRDVEEAVSYWKMAAGNGEPLAQTNLGYCYEAGVGVERSPVRLLFLTSTFPSLPFPSLPFPSLPSLPFRFP